VKWKLRDIVLAVIFSVACGAIYMGWDWLDNLVFGTWSPALQGIVNGMWWIASGLVAYIIRRPGAALFAGVASAFFEFAFGSPYGAGALISGLVQGAGAEAGLMMGGWRRYNVWMMMLSGAVGGVGNTLQWLFQYQGIHYTFSTQMGYFVLTVISGALLAGLLAKAVADALYRSGTLNNFAIAKQRRVQGQ
jgi:energy-coupling factor transport system substrate-specific component